MILSVAASAATQDPHHTVEIAPAKTSIYIGSVTMTMPALHRSGGSYASSYAARVFPYFFYNERGKLTIDFSDEQITQLDRGERVDFKGQAKSESGELRRIEATRSRQTLAAGKSKFVFL